MANYALSSEPVKERSLPTEKTEPVSSKIEAIGRMTAEQIQAAQSLLNAISGGDMPSMPEVESAGMLGQLNQIVAMNVDLCQALKVVCEMIGV